MAPKPVVELRGLTMQFPGVLALDAVDLAMYPGEIHALLGENGAGKSTLIKVLTGVYPIGRGTLLIDGSETRFETPSDARDSGITFVPQDILTIPELSIGRNILLGMEEWGASASYLSAAERSQVNEALARVGVTLDLSAKASSLNVPQLRLAQVARALLQPGHVMVLDEPTAVLSEPDSEHLLERLEAFRKEGKSILYVSHRLSEVMRLADRITVLRDGVRVGHFRRGEITREGIVALMAKDASPRSGGAGGDVAPPSAEHGPVATVLAVRDLSSGTRFRDVSFDVGKHQIIGIAGVQGSGHGSLLRAIAGVDRTASGGVTVDGQLIRSGVCAAFRRGIFLVPADRRGAAIVPRLSIRENIVLSGRVGAALRRFGVRWPARERRMARSYVDLLGVRPPNAEAKIGTLSGGNHQKVALARALESNARVLLVEEPTQGIDVRTKSEIHRLLRQVARERDCAVVVASSEFDELIGLAHTIHVMRLGRLVKTLPGAGVTYRQILEHALP